MEQRNTEIVLIQDDLISDCIDICKKSSLFDVLRRDAVIESWMIDAVFPPPYFFQDLATIFSRYMVYFSGSPKYRGEIRNRRDRIVEIIGSNPGLYGVLGQLTGNLGVSFETSIRYILTIGVIGLLQIGFMGHRLQFGVRIYPHPRP